MALTKGELSEIITGSEYRLEFWSSFNHWMVGIGQPKPAQVATVPLCPTGTPKVEEDKYSTGEFGKTEKTVGETVCKIIISITHTN